MKWVTRENANVDRVACPWLIKRFVDPEAEFLFVGRDEVLAVAEREGAHSYDAAGAEYTHRDGKCSFDVLVEEFDLTEDPGLVRLAQIVHAADVSEDIDSSPEGRGLSAIAHGFALLHGTDGRPEDGRGRRYGARFRAEVQEPRADPGRVRRTRRGALASRLISRRAPYTAAGRM